MDEANIEKIIDVHCHFLQFGNQNNKFLHPKFLKGHKLHTYLLSIGMIKFPELVERSKDLEKFNEQYTQKLITNVNKSKLTHAVVLAFDGVYDEKGELNRKKTQWYVDNDTVFEIAKLSNKTIPGASINPKRRDWKEEFEKCVENKVALVKWLPSVMGFDPDDKSIIPFYEMLVEEEIPLLSHVGFEYAVKRIDDRFSELEKLKLPLEMGVTVIAAHCCGGRMFIDNKKQFQKLVEEVKKSPNLYLDNSATASMHRKSRLKNVANNNITHSRLVYGTDYPLPASKLAFIKELGLKDYLKSEKNPFNLDIKIKKAMGLKKEDFSRGYEVINQKIFL